MEARQAAINYVKSMTTNERQKLKAMLSHGILCGKDCAVQNEVNPVVFNAELKAILEGR